MQLIVELGLIILAAKLAGHLSTRIGQPAVLGELLAGIVLGPALLGWISDSEIVHLISEIGVILLMFIAGLETDLEGLKESARSSSAVAVGGIVFPLLFGYLTGGIMGMAPSHSIFLGLILSATSVSISVQTLKELGKLQAKESITLLGAAVLDDVIVILLLALVMSVFGGADSNILLLIGTKLIFFATAILFSWKGVPVVLRVLGSLRVSEPMVSAAVILCFMFAWYADLLGLAGIIGSFIAGVAISKTSFKEKVEHKIEPIAYSFFTPVFFISIGLHVTFKGISDQMGFIVIMTLIAVLTKFVGSGLGAWMTGYNRLSSARIGAGMVSRGEVALILASAGIDTQLLNKAFYTPLIMVVLLTTLITPPLLKLLFREKDGVMKKEN
ncbi:cation:proton antiporter [Sporolactobacillus shoreae]|uniref:Cation:proton antiporter n=1 Tax=Sporolactobacillus shoreae TaxID=1465501 RepID=A0A4Z0GHQ1_9BACL|nr:cation:proton antiporter [Sporolactobacillus shoreae]TGA96241.1 cation:proton antiporter [Sporolactobacillus shoreae]